MKYLSIVLSLLTMTSIMGCDSASDDDDNIIINPKYHISNYQSGDISDQSLSGLWIAVSQIISAGAGPDGGTTATRQERRIVQITDFADGTGLISICDPEFPQIAFEVVNDNLQFTLGDVFNATVYDLTIVNNHSLQGQLGGQLTVLRNVVVTFKGTVNMLKLSDVIIPIGNLNLFIEDDITDQDDSDITSSLYDASCFIESEGSELVIENPSGLSIPAAFNAIASKRLLITAQDRQATVTLNLRFDELNSQARTVPLTYLAFGLPVDSDNLPAGSFQATVEETKNPEHFDIANDLLLLEGVFGGLSPVSSGSNQGARGDYKLDLAFEKGTDTEQ